jgi:hypothetical protein
VKLRLALGALISVALLAAAAGAAEARSLRPPSGKVWAGVSDTGQLADFERLRGRLGKHPALIQTFHHWGIKPGGAALRRWQAADVRPVLAISTAAGGGPELITPGQIAAGAGDDYLIVLNRLFGGKRPLPAFIRPFGEMNGAHNPYCAYGPDGRRRDGAHSAAALNAAWRRIVIVVRGGGSRAQINRRLARAGLGPLSARREALPARLAPAPVSFIWTPQLRSWPNVAGNEAERYWPGGRYVDWIGTDVYSGYSFALLEDFYRRFARRPFAIAEFGVVGSENPAFIDRIGRWIAEHRRAQMALYYQGFGADDPYSPYRYPRSLARLAAMLRAGRYLPFVPERRP